MDTLPKSWPQSQPKTLRFPHPQNMGCTRVTVGVGFEFPQFGTDGMLTSHEVPFLGLDGRLKGL